MIKRDITSMVLRLAKDYPRWNQVQSDFEFGVF